MSILSRVREFLGLAPKVNKTDVARDRYDGPTSTRTRPVPRATNHRKGVTPMDLGIHKGKRKNVPSNAKRATRRRTDGQQDRGFVVDDTFVLLDGTVPDDTSYSAGYVEQSTPAAPSDDYGYVSGPSNMQDNSQGGNYGSGGYDSSPAPSYDPPSYSSGGSDSGYSSGGGYSSDSSGSSGGGYSSDSSGSSSSFD